MPTNATQIAADVYDFSDFAANDTGNGTEPGYPCSGACDFSLSEDVDEGRCHNTDSKRFACFLSAVGMYCR